MTTITERIELALGAMRAAGPRDLRAFLAQPAPDVPPATASEITQMLDTLLSDDPNNPSRLRFSDALRGWDNAKDASWIGGTRRNTRERRALIHEKLKSGDSLGARIDGILPFFPLEEPLIIATEHEDWYKPQDGVRDYYWATYRSYLRTHRKWEDASIMSLSNHTQAVIECLANPESKRAYAARGLVMGFVQSGKTANFMGVTARAADAGYRLIIVLAGTWNILRNQTQRRFDKELLGKELLFNDESYTLNPPADWADFLEHGTDPVMRAGYAWQRLTRPDIDFRRLRAAIDSLEFEKPNKAAALFDPVNLHALPVKLLVVKKHSGILRNLVRDLLQIRTKLTDLPAIIIDDESDQAGINTVNPARPPKSGKERTATNECIVKLLGLFPRGQYIGYTATPYANALVNPDDPEDLYPRDFILPLDRPIGYMGVADFFDPTTAYADLNKEDYALPEIAHIRRVSRLADDDDEDLKNALRSYVLSGGVKLYRQSADAARYKAEYFKHHTMLVHTSSRRGAHASLAARVKDLWDACAFNTPTGLAELETLWTNDYSKVSVAHKTDVLPPTFADLIPPLSEAIKRIERGSKVYMVVNSDSNEAPDFSADSIWKIVVGGNKLSRGYTIEGLTVSYYRRVTGTGDTLMQMGRWFGFRPGYRDLVRVFLGVSEGRRQKGDLVALFKQVCLMEDRFREEIQRYVRRPGHARVTPLEVPALISVTGSLPPTARNKMFNARLVSKNYGGQMSMPTLLPSRADSTRHNVGVTTTLLMSAHNGQKLLLGGATAKGREVQFEAYVLRTTTKDIIAFLSGYRWLEDEFGDKRRPADISFQIEFLGKHRHGITAWTIVAPQRQKSFGPAIQFGNATLTTKERHREDEDRGFQVFGEPDHRLIGRYLAGLSAQPGKDSLKAPTKETTALARERGGVLLLYPVREDAASTSVSVGFELIYPENDLDFDLNFAVRRKSEQDEPIVDAEGAS